MNVSLSLSLSLLTRHILTHRQHSAHLQRQKVNCPTCIRCLLEDGRHLLVVDGAEVGVELLLLIVGEAVPVGDEVALIELLQGVPQVLHVHGEREDESSESCNLGLSSNFTGAAARSER